MIAPRAVLSAGLLVGVALVSGAASAAEPVVVEFHFKPVPDLQIAIWLEDGAGKFVQDVFVTQATGKYGIGNRPGRWDFLSSWRAPYGPRLSVLPVWAHRRGTTYPQIIFYDDNPADLESLGWHETTSSAENYFCKPLTASEHEVVSVDAKTCPSPQGFNSDKGRLNLGEVSVYPPRNDLLEFDPSRDHTDVQQFASLNDLDAVTAATPVGEQSEVVTALLSAEVVERGPLVAYIEVSRERDENSHYSYTREDDHYVDPRLTAYGIEYLGQPSVVYRVEFDPGARGFTGATEYAGHGDWNGATGTLHAPDGTISVEAGSGADRLRVVTLHGETFRWGVFSYGPDGVDTGGDDGWGQCKPRELPAVEDLSVTGLSFDRVAVTFTLPPWEFDSSMLGQLHVFHITGEAPLTEALLGAAHVRSFHASELGDPSGPVTVEVDQLWGDYTYQFGVAYEDKCTNRSALATTTFTTEPQKFQTVEGACFLATAAYGAPWAAQVQALRDFRDGFLKTSPAGLDLVRFYYLHSPPLARVIEREPLLRGLARVVLQPVADAARVATR